MGVICKFGRELARCMEDAFLTCWRCRLRVARMWLKDCEDVLEEE
jgi:hypothetical protein